MKLTPPMEKISIDNCDRLCLSKLVTKGRESDLIDCRTHNNAGHPLASLWAMCCPYFKTALPPSYSSTLIEDYPLVNETEPVSIHLFPDGKKHLFASSMVIWEACNVIAQNTSLPWQTDSDGRLIYEKVVQQGKGFIQFHLDHCPPQLLKEQQAGQVMEQFDLRAACVHLIYAACATELDRPWEQEFILSDQQIATYLGLDKRKDLSKQERLKLITTIAQQPCLITTAINWPQQGKIPGFNLEEAPLWNLTGIEYHCQNDSQGNTRLVGITFTIRPGIWSQYFLNRQGYQEKNAFYQYGTLPKFILETIMRIWQHHEGAARILLWLLFKIRLGQTQPVKVSTLMGIGYGREKVTQAYANLKERKKLIRSFEADLEVLYDTGFHPYFDPITYPDEIQPLWFKLLQLPEDNEAQLQFWVEDGAKSSRITDIPPRGKWQMLMNARILGFEIPPQLKDNSKLSEYKKTTPAKLNKLAISSQLTGEQIKAARQRQGVSQRQLANELNKSQSWVRDIENGRLKLQPADEEKLRKVLKLPY